MIETGKYNFDDVSMVAKSYLCFFVREGGGLFERSFEQTTKFMV